MSADVRAHPDLVQVLAAAGRHDRLRSQILDALREAQAEAEDPAAFREQVRWPLIESLLRESPHQIVLENGLIFEVSPDSRIERALLLSAVAHPDHVWEPQTTKLLTTLAAEEEQVIVGGAYIGDQVLPIAKAMSQRPTPGQVHAFEPMEHAFRRLLRNLELNGITNVHPHRLGLWDCTDASLVLDGAPGVASSLPTISGAAASGEIARSITIDDYVAEEGLRSVGLIMLDTEGGEEAALRGAFDLLDHPHPNAPHVVFEVHRNFVDWSEGLPSTSIVQLMTSRDFFVFAIRDFHGNEPTRGFPIEIVPIESVYLEGPPHGFNLLCTKDDTLIKRLDLRVVEGVSPKLLLDKDPRLHHPYSWSWPRSRRASMAHPAHT